MTAFPIRGLEIHNQRMWRWDSIDRALDFMVESRLNTLILHQNDLIDSVVFPPAAESPELMYSRWPILRSTLAANRLYLHKVVTESADRGIRVYAEVKELWYPDELLELMPELRGPDGVVCPTHPYWEQYLGDKLAAVFRELPGLGGIIVSPATRESKATIATRACHCRRCEATSAQDWYEWLLRTMHEPIAAHRATLVVRDFAYTASEQSVLLAAACAVSDDIVMALKNVPHDFWPTFPDNPAIGRGGGLRQWVEFDVLGQYCGLGAVPCSLVSDLRSRLQKSRDAAVDGVWFRTDWELIGDLSVFNSLNLLNLRAAAALSADPGATDEDIFAAWSDWGILTALVPESMLEPRRATSGDDAGALLGPIMAGTWPAVQGALYTRGHVFQYSSKIAPSLDDFFYVPERYHSREQWDPGSLTDVAVTPENIVVIVDEKERAAATARELLAKVEEIASDLPERLRGQIVDSFRLLVLYVDVYRRVVPLGFLAALALQSGEVADRDRALQAADALARVRSDVQEALVARWLPHYWSWLFDLGLLEGFENDVRSQLARVEVEA